MKCDEIAVARLEIDNYLVQNCFTELRLDEALAVCGGFSYGNGPLPTRRVSLGAHEVQAVRRALASLDIPHWREHYINDNILDGVGWKLSLTLRDAHKLVRSGENDFPQNCQELERIFADFSVQQW